MNRAFLDSLVTDELVNVLSNSNIEVITKEQKIDKLKKQMRAKGLTVAETDAMKGNEQAIKRHKRLENEVTVDMQLEGRIRRNTAIALILDNENNYKQALDEHIKELTKELKELY